MRSIKPAPRIKSEPFLEVVQKGLAHWNRYAAVAHIIVLRNDSLLACTEHRVWREHDDAAFFPQDVFVWLSLRFAVASGLKATREQEILELLVDMAVGAHVPPQAVTSESMRCYP